MTPPWLERASSLPELAALRAAVAADRLVRLQGLTGPARLLYPLLATSRPILVVVPSERDIDGTVEDLRTLVAEMGDARQVLPCPAPGPPPFRGLARHAEASLRRAAVLFAAHRGRLRAAVASPAGLLRPTVTREIFETRAFVLNAGDDMTPEILLEALDEAGYRREDPVTAPGQTARRGGILDVFPPDRDWPVRLEFLGDTIESLRSFDPDTQRSREDLPGLEIVPLSDAFAPRSVVQQLRGALTARFGARRDLELLIEKLDHGLVPDDLPDLLPLVPTATVPLWEHLRGAVPVVLEPESVLAEAEAFMERAVHDHERRAPPLSLSPAEGLVGLAPLTGCLNRSPGLHLQTLQAEDADVSIASRPVPRYSGDTRRLLADLRASAERSVLFLANQGRADRVRDLLKDDGLAVGHDAAIDTRVGSLSEGFELPGAGLRVLADSDLFPEEVHVQGRRRRSLRGVLSDFRDLRIGDLVVHEDHGVGRFLGLETLVLGDGRVEVMVLGYQGGDKLKIPVHAFDRVEKYGSREGAKPAIDRLGSGRWETVKRRVRKAMRDMAAELLKLYAERKARPGHAFAGDSPWHREFEEAFEYDETPDQAAAISDIAADMASPTPMDRLVCGDVGYGKTEVAMRAAMTAVLDSKQVAVLAPTTVLAFQHWKTFRKRFAPFPVVVEMVSRFRSPREVKTVVANLAAGKVDILIGTHRLLSKDVVFRDLGLLIIDEEQRFGVGAKERLKQLRTTIDCLTLSATPIPRTLQMGLTGIRDMSVIETPPKDRLAIQTSILKFSTESIAAALDQELARGGQVYFVHNRVESIFSVAALVQNLAPEGSKVAVAHGQMPEAELEKAMLAFVEGRADILVATTLIENGLDIPRANTIIINRADRYGLAQLYQLRGRVGRADRRAFAYLLVPPDTVLSEIARRRLAAVQEFSDLGAGFRIAALDLELRGAGNLLGGAQSGHIDAIGLDMYVKLLEQTVLEMRGQEARSAPATALNLRVDLRIPEDYVPDAQQRMSLYKRISELPGENEADGLRTELRDRYGPPPAGVDGLLRYSLLRSRAQRLGIVQVDRGRDALHVRFAPAPAVSPAAVMSIAAGRPGARLTGDGALWWPLSSTDDAIATFQALVAGLEREVAAEAGTTASAL